MTTQRLAFKVGLGFAMIGLVFATAMTLTLLQVEELKQTHSGLQLSLIEQSQLLTNSSNNVQPIQAQLQQAQMTLHQVQNQLETLSLIDSLLLIIGFTLCGIFALVLTKFIGRPINRLVNLARSITLGHLNQQVDIKGAYEFDELSQAFQKMINQLDENRTRLLQQKQALQNSNKQLQLASEYKSAFMANMSHEFKTPLNSIILLAKMMRENHQGNLSAQQIESAAVIQRSGKELFDLINDILDLAKVEAGKLKVVIDDVILEPLVKELKDEFEIIANNKALVFDLDMAANTVSTIETDRGRLKQILRNLVSNAIKFTNQGSVTLKITNSEQQQVIMQINDTGCGISQDDLSLIFQAFEQGNKVHPETQNGTGLGLSISLHLAKLLGGKLAATSQLGKGSQFTLTLPIQQGAEINTPLTRTKKEFSHELSR